MAQHNSLVYGLLIAASVGMLFWQGIEHSRFRTATRETLINRGRDITTTLGLVIRSQRRWGRFLSQERLDPALHELVKADQVTSISLVNVDGEIVATAGEMVDFQRHLAGRSGLSWGDDTVTLINLVDLDPTTNVVQEGQPIIVLPRRDPNSTNAPDPRGTSRSGRRGPGGGETRSGQESGLGAIQEGSGETNAENASVPRPEDERRRGEPRRFPPDPDLFGTSGTNSQNRSFFRRPPWMSESDYATLTQKQGVHSFVVVLSTNATAIAIRRDLWMRFLTVGLAALASGGLAVAWRNLAKFSELELRLLKASEMNHHLRELNTAAAGLAHETRNPLNIIRGLAQIISRQKDTAPEIRTKTQAITDEVDRVTAQLNEFINYSKPREVRRTGVSLDIVIGDVTRALECDLEEKTVELSYVPSHLIVEADEPLFRQLLFNLMLNAVQAVQAKGEVRIAAKQTSEGWVSLEIADNGPGVPADQREEIFKPYFTTQPKGTGLGLAVVKQIVLAHGWEIHVDDAQPRGAVFRLNHLRPIVSKYESSSRSGS